MTGCTSNYVRFAKSGWNKCAKMCEREEIPLIFCDVLWLLLSEVLYNRCVTSIPRLWYTKKSHESASLERETKYECEFFFGSRLIGPILDWYQQWLISNKKMECKSKIRQNGDLMIFNNSNGRLLRNQQTERSSKDLCNNKIYVQRVPRKKEKCASRLIQNRSWTWLHILVNHPSFCGNRLKFSSGSLGQ